MMIGLVDAAMYGALAALIFVPFYNYFSSRLG